MILQQTRVAQGMSYYHRFLELFPDVVALASAPEDLVLKCWQGLGYYSRARNLLAAARRIVEMHGGVFPTDYADVRALPGVGDYTAAAICSIAYDEPCAALDGNVFRVLSRLYDLDTPIDTTSGRRTFAALADSLIDRQRPGLTTRPLWISGLFAVFRYSPAVRSARCATVVWLLPPVRSMSVPSNRGVRLSNPAISTTCTSNAAMNWCCADGVPATFGRGCTNFRSSKLPNLWNIRCWPRCRSFALSSKIPGRYALLRTVTMPVHQLSHRAIHAVFYRIVVERWTPSLREMLVIPREILGDYAVSRLTERYLSR